jgi:hypothetical protein
LSVIFARTDVAACEGNGINCNRHQLQPEQHWGASDMNNFQLKALAAAIIATTVTACGGGGGGGSVDIGNPPISAGDSSAAVSSGTIDGFGSIFVNGIEYETGDAEIIVNGQAADESALSLGMVVSVRGDTNDDGATGNALRVVFDNEVKGPISAIEPTADNDAKLLTVLGIVAIVERTGTVFDDVTFDSLAVGDLVEISGFRETDSRLRASRVEKKSQFVPGQSEVEVKGVISNLGEQTFNLGSLVVDFSTASLEDIPGGTLTNGLTVEVKGTAEENLVQATRIERASSVTDLVGTDDDFSVQGPITNADGNLFQINGVRVDASGATLFPTGLTLANGAFVEAEGVWNGEVLLATRVEARRGRIEIEAAVDAIEGDSIRLGLFNGTVTILTDSTTLVDGDTDDDGDDNLRVSDLRAGDFLEIEAVQNGDQLLATRIDRDDRDDDVIQAPVSAFIPGVSITLLGITYSATGAEFEDGDDADLSTEQFFAQLQIGDLVKVKDELTTDGVADEVEFEDKDVQDGGIPV